jgi:transcriptional regulator with XRE-family HTH domain
MIATDELTKRERGERLKKLRSLSGYTSIGLAEAAGVSRASVSYWENGSTNTGLTENGAEKIVKAVQLKNVRCSIEWLLYGLGSPPSKSESGIIFPSVYQEIATQTQEIELFMTNPGAVVINTYTTAIQPIITKGDIVGGIWLDPAMADIQEIISIIEINNKLQIRKVKKSVDTHGYDVSYISYPADLNEPFELKGILLDKVAPIIRLWRPIR